MNLTVIIALILVALLAFAGFRRGLISSVWHFAGTIIVIAITIVLAPMVTKVLSGNEKIYNKVYEKVEQTLDLKVIETGKVDIEELMGDLQLPESFISLFNEKTASIDSAQREAVESVYRKATDGVISGIAYIATFVVVLIICSIVVAILNKVVKLPGLNALNKVAGLAIGVLEGALIIWAICGLIPVFAATKYGSVIIGQINENAVLRFFYEHNLISTVISARLLALK